MTSSLLIVDDDLNVVKQLKWTFHDQFEIVHAMSLPEIDAAVERSAPVAVLVDMHLPPTLHTPQTGIEIVRHLRRTHPSLIIIGISVSLDPSIPVEIKQAGATSFLQKPFNSDALKSLLAITA